MQHLPMWPDNEKPGLPHLAPIPLPPSLSTQQPDSPINTSSETRWGKPNSTQPNPLFALKYLATYSSGTSGMA